MEKYKSTRVNPIALKRDAVRFWQPLTTLSTHFISAERLRIIFAIKERVDANTISRFIELNRANMAYLDVKIEPSYTPGKLGIWIYAGRYAGAIPIKSPQSSLYTLDMAVRGSYSPSLSDDDIFSILSEIGAECLPEYNDRLRLVSSSLKPPMYVECEKFIQIYEKVLRSQWKKFQSITKEELIPRGNTNWTRYALQSYNPQAAFTFSNRRNVLTSIHKELRQINYVLSVAIESIERLGSTSGVMKRNRILISKLRNIPEAKIVELTDRLTIKSLDPPLVRHLKEIGNCILSNTSHSFLAWRLDIAKLFEFYVQAAFKRIGDGWKVKCNPKYPITGCKHSWNLSYLEPDILLRRLDQEIIIDAKYKSHLLNVNSSNAVNLKDSFRHDLHQVLAYSAFTPGATKHAVLIYPIIAPIPTIISTQTINTPFNTNRCKIVLMGLPLVKNNINQTTTLLRSLLPSQ